jgi:putative ATP-dependent endonuclease of OLD family
MAYPGPRLANSSGASYLLSVNQRENKVRIESVSIKNLRCVKNSTAYLEPYTCFVGPNGAGKSTVLCALNIFFRNEEGSPLDLNSLAAQDFHLQVVNDPIEINVTFADLSDEAKQDFKEYFRQEKLTVSAVAHFDSATGRAVVKQFGQRLGMEAFKPFFKALGDKVLVPALQKLFDEICEKHPDVAALKIKTTKEGMSTGLKDYEASHPDKCVLIPSEDQFYGVSNGANRLAKFVQWIYVPAVKDATEEESGTKASALGRLLARTVSAKLSFTTELDSLVNDARIKYQAILDLNQTALDGISTSLKNRLVEWAHPLVTLRVEWENDPNKAVSVAAPIAGVIAGESGFEGKLGRLGHGFQRSFLLALLQELASFDDKDAPTLILGCEEPELYQHPPQARHLASVFEKLSSQGSQIIVTTHSPYFVTGENFESVRMVRRDIATGASIVRQFTFAELAKRYAEVMNQPLRNPSATSAKLHQAMQPSLGEMFFTQKLILVEGLEDVAYLQVWLALTGRWESFRRSGSHIVGANGKSELIRPAIIALGLKIPLLVVFDADGDKLTKTDASGQKVDNPSVRLDHERDNRALLRLLGGDENNLFPTGVLWCDQLVVWPSDLGDTVKREFIISLGAQGQQQFDVIRGRANSDAGNAGGLEKNSVYIGYLLQRLHEAGATSASLDKLCDFILSFPAATSS